MSYPVPKHGEILYDYVPKHTIQRQPRACPFHAHGSRFTVHLTSFGLLSRCLQGENKHCCEQGQLDRDSHPSTIMSFRNPKQTFVRCILFARVDPLTSKSLFIPLILPRQVKCFAALGQQTGMDPTQRRG